MKLQFTFSASHLTIDHCLCSRESVNEWPVDGMTGCLTACLRRRSYCEFWCSSRRDPFPPIPPPTGSKLGQRRAPDWDDTQTTHTKSCQCNTLFIVCKTGQLGPRWPLSTVHIWAVNRRQDNSTSSPSFFASHNPLSLAAHTFSQTLWLNRESQNKWGLGILNVFSPHLLLLWCGYTYLLFLLIF